MSSPAKRGRPVVGTEDLAKRAQALRQKGLTVRKIAARLGISKSLAGELIHVDFEKRREEARRVKAEEEAQELEAMRAWFHRSISGPKLTDT